MSKEKETVAVAEPNVTRRSMLKWAGGLAAAAVAGAGLGYGASEILRPSVPPETITTTETVTVTATETLTPAAPAKEEVFAIGTMNGPRLVYVRDGRVIRSGVSIPVPAGADHPRFKGVAKPFNPPLKSINGPIVFGYRDYTYAADRIRYPMKRVGLKPGPQTDDSVANRGKGEFVRITWDEALDIVASELKRMWEVYGAGAVCN